MLVLGSMTSCVKTRTPVEISFVTTLGEQAVGCDDNDIGLSDLRFYVSELAYVDDAGRKVPVQLQADGQWQSDAVALLDLENGLGRCDNGTQVTNARILGDISPGSYVELQFDIGVPFALNHANPLQAEPPLNDPAMHWHWRSGYKFMRIGIATNDDRFWTHLGSTGCQGTVRNIESCDAANRLVVNLPIPAEGNPEIIVDLSVLAASTDLLDKQPADCSSGPAESSCRAIFAALGLQHHDSLAPQKQQLFKVRE